MDAVTGSWSGVEIMVYLYQCHIRASVGREWVMPPSPIQDGGAFGRSGYSGS